MKNYKDIWKELANAKKNSVTYTVQYCLIKATKAKANNRLEIAEALLRRAFTPITNKVKLDNGSIAYESLQYTLRLCVLEYNQTILLGCPKEQILTEEEFQIYKDIISKLWLTDFESTENDWVYIIVRQDMSPEYQAVQAAHAAFKAGNTFECKPDETYFCLVGVKDKAALEDACGWIKYNNIDYSAFVEPDIGSQLTAIATRPIKDHRRRVFRHFKRLEFGRA